MKRILLALTLLISCLFVSCTSSPNLSQMQNRSITSKEVQANTKIAFKATLAILQDNGYVIKSSDSNAGILSAEKALDNDNIITDKRSYIMISASVSDVTANVSKVRLTITERTIVNSIIPFVSKDKIVEVKDKAVYDSLLNAIKIEAERLKMIR